MKLTTNSRRIDLGRVSTSTKGNSFAVKEQIGLQSPTTGLSKR